MVMVTRMVGRVRIRDSKWVRERNVGIKVKKGGSRDIFLIG